MPARRRAGGRRSSGSRRRRSRAARRAGQTKKRFVVKPGTGLKPELERKLVAARSSASKEDLARTPSSAVGALPPIQKNEGAGNKISIEQVVSLLDGFKRLQESESLQKPSLVDRGVGAVQKARSALQKTKEFLGTDQPPDIRNPLDVATRFGVVGGAGAGEKILVAGERQLTKKLPGFVERVIGRSVKPGEIKGIGKAGKLSVEGKSLLRKVFTKSIEQTKTITTTNPKTGKKTTKVITEVVDKNRVSLGVVAATVGAAAFIVEKSLGGKQFGRFLGQEEASQTAGMAAWMAAQSDNYDAYLEARELQKSVLGINISEIPYSNVAEGIDSYRETALRAGEIMDKVMLDKQSGDSPDEYWRKRDEEKAAQEKASIDYYNAQRLALKQREVELEKELAEFRASVRVKSETEIIKRREASARRQRELIVQQTIELNKLEEEERKKIAEFWLEYRKAVFELESQQRRSSWDEGFSSLSFGI